MSYAEQSPKRERGVKQSPKRERGVKQSPKRERGVSGVRRPAQSCGPVADTRDSDPRAGRPVADTRDSDPRAGRPVAHAPGSDRGSVPLAYLITFTTYGTWLHGDERGSVDPEHNAYRTPHLARNQQRECYEKSAQKAEPVALGNKQRAVIRQTIAEVCEHRDWCLHELNVRTNHVHAVVSAKCRPERIMNDFKSWATRRLREGELVHGRRSPWTEHGSTRYLWKPTQLAAACRYVLDGQGPDL